MFDIAGIVDRFPYVGIFVLLILGEIGFPFPEDATLILGGFLTAHGVIKPLPAFSVLYKKLLLNTTQLAGWMKTGSPKANKDDISWA